MRKLASALEGNFANILAILNEVSEKNIADVAALSEKRSCNLHQYSCDVADAWKAERRAIACQLVLVLLPMCN